MLENKKLCEVCKCASKSPLALFILLFLLKFLANGCFWDSIIEQQNIKLDTRHMGVINVFVSIYRFELVK